MSDNPHFEWRKAMEGPHHMSTRQTDAALRYASDEIDRLRAALDELLEAFDICVDDMDLHEYEAIVEAAKAKGRAALSKAS